MSHEVPEFIQLNMAELSVEELEHRLELASLAPTADCWSHNNCGQNHSVG
jgi:hypothetical protein